MKKGIIGEIVRDKTVDFVDRLFDSSWFDRACWAIIGLVMLYFGPFVVRAFLGG